MYRLSAVVWVSLPPIALTASDAPGPATAAPSTAPAIRSTPPRRPRPKSFSVIFASSLAFPSKRGMVGKVGWAARLGGLDRFERLGEGGADDRAGLAHLQL